MKERLLFHILFLSLGLVPAFGQTQVVLLGTGTPGAEPDRSGPAVAVIVDSSAYLVDCGPGVVRRASMAYHLGIWALRPDRLTRAFVTHLHSDHTAGYPDLILTPWVIGRKDPLLVFGPPGLQNMTEHLLKAYQEDIEVRLQGMEAGDPKGIQVIPQEVTSGLVYQDTQVKVRAFPVSHGSWEHALGYRFETPDRTIVISGDTAPSKSLIENAKGCDILVHEVYSRKGFEQGSPSFQSYHSSFHTSTVELVDIANQVKPDLLVLYHLLFFGTSEEDLLKEIQDHYKGKVVVGNDLDVY